MRGLYLRSVIGLFFVFSVINVFAQRSSGLTIEGKVSVQEGSTDGAIIQMFRDGQKLNDYGIGSDGRYKLELDYNHKFELIFVRENNFSQKIAIETAIPNNVLQSNPKFPPFPVNINLFTEVAGIDKTFSEKTVLKIYYSPNVENFIPELYYNDAQIKKLIEQAILQSKVVGKESDYLSKLTRAERAELRREYNQLLEQAGKEYSDEKFLVALDGFKAASKIFPNEQFPKDRIAEINDLLGMMMIASELDKAMAERFTELIKEADLLFNKNNYSDARNSYHRALSIQPNDTYALAQVNKIDDLIINEQDDKKYNDLIEQADDLHKQILYTEAIGKYQEALQVKPDEDYPKTKIDEINQFLVDQRNNLEKQENYKQAMFQAGTYFEKQFYDKSMASYQNALEYKPGDAKATERIAEIKGITKEITNRIYYDKLIKEADKSYKKKLYAEALLSYNEASVLFPEEARTNKRIKEINEILDLNKNFADLVYKADNQFISENYEASKELYRQALELQSTDKHSRDRVSEIDGIMAAQGADAEYNLLIAKADGLFDDNNYENAKGIYTEALSVKSKEKYPRNRIAEINSILQQIAKTNQSYEQAIAKADGLFKQKNYEDSRNAFAGAGQIKPDETYPPEMISKIDVLIEEQTRLLAEKEAAEQARLAAEAKAEKERLAAQTEAERIRLAEVAAAEAARLAALQAEKDKNYTETIARADNQFNNSDYENARNEYRAASVIKPDETYPQEKITEIENLLSALALAKQKQESQDRNYTNLIQQADQFFSNSNYTQAREKYGNALDLKEEENYPKEKIFEIDEILKQQKLEDSYRLVLVAADGFFKTENYTEAKAGYEEALALKSEEQYPKSQLAKIEDILQKEQLEVEDMQRRTEEIAIMNKEIEVRDAEGDTELTSLYNEFIQKADAFFNDEQYNVSRAWYYQALDVKPDESYPPQRIAEINELIGNLLLSQRDHDYQKYINLGDSTFRANELAVARGWYNQALSIKDNEAYPKSQIAEIQKRIADRMAGQQYNAHIEKASEAFDKQSYGVARFWYKKALELRPDDETVKARLDEIKAAFN